MFVEAGADVKSWKLTSLYQRKYVLCMHLCAPWVLIFGSVVSCTHTHGRARSCTDQFIKLRQDKKKDTGPSDHENFLESWLLGTHKRQDGHSGPGPSDLFAGRARWHQNNFFFRARTHATCLLLSWARLKNSVQSFCGKNVCLCKCISFGWGGGNGIFLQPRS